MKKSKLKIVPTYSFWRHPIKWIKERKTRIIMEVLMNKMWDKDMEKSINQAVADSIINGTGILTTGRDYFVKIDPDNLVVEEECECLDCADIISLCKELK